MHDVAILGCGTMGEAILTGLQRASQLTVRATVKRPIRADALRAAHGIEVGHDNAAAAAAAKVVIVAVKPQKARSILDRTEMAEATRDTLVVSICAGVRLDQLRGWLPHARLIRAMPNTPATIGAGMTVLSPDDGATEEDIALARHVFETVGRVRILDETHLDAVTALSGSGPAFACVIIEALADGGVMMGLPRDVAIELAAQTVRGAGELVLQTGTHPAALKDDVTTPAGCTIAGLLTMEDGRIRSTLARTIQEATRVASGLGQD